MSALVDRALQAAGLGALLEARRAGKWDALHGARLREVDLLALGALADRVRAEEVGDEVRIYPDLLDGNAGDMGARVGRHGDERVIVLPGASERAMGLELLREVAIARVTGPRAAHIRVRWALCGLEIAQVALGFGADELSGTLANKRGLPLADGELLGVGKRSRLEPAEAVKRRELAGFVRLAGRSPRFVHEETTT